MKFSDFPIAVIKENVEYTVKEITNVIKKYGPRESASDNCFAAEKHLKKELDQFCDETRFEEYDIAPKAFLHFTKTISVAIILVVVVGLALALAGVLTYTVAHVIVAVTAAVSLFITVMEFLLYKQFCDVLYKKKKGHNLVAVRKPKGEVKKRFVISGHIDAAYEWRHLYYAKGKYPFFGITVAGSVGTALISIIIAIINVIASFTDMGAFGEFMLNYSYYFHILTAVFLATLYPFINFKLIAPGANDNLTGTYAAVCALRMMDMAGVEFENTELVAMITDGEEAGLRGSKAFAKDHLEEYTSDEVETAVLCCDTLTDYDFINVYSKDMTNTVNNDKEFSDLVLDSAKEVGIENAKLANLFFGASDAAAFSQAGIKATCLAAMDPTPADYYHNRRDNYDRLVPKSIEACYKIIIASILNFDENGTKKN
ncbi:MAG: M20/M25/M40 family metallo-hydrolase [Eubacterium sp.]|nr:M20/M25/M40 family metallo-hydrolase [Eubacterium sp.]